MPKSTAPPVRPLAFRVRDVQQLIPVSRAHIYNLIQRGALRRLELKDDPRTVLIDPLSVYEYLGIDPAKDGAA
jgi:predicted DNA-binding transcriptional regulator AlpA